MMRTTPELKAQGHRSPIYPRGSGDLQDRRPLRGPAGGQQTGGHSQQLGATGLEVGSMQKQCCGGVETHGCLGGTAG